MAKLKEEREVVFYEISDFKYHLRDDKRLSENTINAYIVDLEQYAVFMKKYQNITDVLDVEREHILKYIQSLKRRDLSVASISRKIIAIKEFHTFLVNESIAKENPALLIDSPKQEHKLPVVLTIDEINKMISSIDGDKPIDLRNKAMMELLYASGMRISELLSIKINNIHFREKYINVIGKGDKERLVPIGDMATLAIKKYLEKGRDELKPKSNLLFLNYKGEEMSRQGFYKYIINLAKECGIEKEISPHTIRHSFATHLLSGGVDLRVIQELLGHEDISTTQIYTHIDKTKLKEIYDNTHPLAKGENDV